MDKKKAAAMSFSIFGIIILYQILIGRTINEIDFGLALVVAVVNLIVLLCMPVKGNHSNAAELRFKFLTAVGVRVFMLLVGIAAVLYGHIHMKDASVYFILLGIFLVLYEGICFVRKREFDCSPFVDGLFFCAFSIVIFVYDGLVLKYKEIPEMVILILIFLYGSALVWGNDWRRRKAS